MLTGDKLRGSALVRNIISWCLHVINLLDQAVGSLEQLSSGVVPLSLEARSVGCDRAKTQFMNLRRVALTFTIERAFCHLPLQVSFWTLSTAYSAMSDGKATRDGRMLSQADNRYEIGVLDDPAAASHK